MGVREGRHKDKERLERTDDTGLLALKMEEETTTQGLLVTSRRSKDQVNDSFQPLLCVNSKS